jgi:hypothetical protein
MRRSHSRTAATLKANPQTDAEILEAAHRLVELYLVYLREHDTGNDLFDTRDLPASKAFLVNAFGVVIATENRPGMRAHLVESGLTLAQFQDNIGEPVKVTPIPQINGRRGFRNSRVNIAQMRKFDRALLRVGEERVRLGNMFQNALRIAEKKPVHHA